MSKKMDKSERTKKMLVFHVAAVLVFLLVPWPIAHLGAIFSVILYWVYLRPKGVL